MEQKWKTEEEILSQPDIWLELSGFATATAQKVRDWMQDIGIQKVWFSGAGSSAFIGEVITESLNSIVDGISFRNVPSTDLVAGPEIYLNGAGSDLLVVSFGRSGDSSESIGTMDLLDKYAPDVNRLNITCNSNGILATRPCAGPGRKMAAALPVNCLDQGFAMTRSFTSMLFTALACFDNSSDCGNLLTRFAELSRDFISAPLNIPHSKRAVFIGSGPLQGIARESALKVLELSAGRIAAFWNSSLGFRHGPKAVLDDESSVFVYLSNDGTTRKYDEDIAGEISVQYPCVKLYRIGCGRIGFQPPDLALDSDESDLWNSGLFVTAAQKLAMEWAIDLGVPVDNPFESEQKLSRVVSDVKLYTQ